MLLRDIALQDDDVNIADIRELRLQLRRLKKPNRPSANTGESASANEKSIWEIARNHVYRGRICGIEPRWILYTYFDDGVQVVLECGNRIRDDEWLIERIDCGEKVRPGHAVARKTVRHISRMTMITDRWK